MPKIVIRRNECKEYEKARHGVWLLRRINRHKNGQTKKRVRSDRLFGVLSSFGLNDDNLLMSIDRIKFL